MIINLRLLRYVPYTPLTCKHDTSKNVVTAGKWKFCSEVLMFELVVGNLDVGDAVLFLNGFWAWLLGMLRNQFRKQQCIPQTSGFPTTCSNYFKLIPCCYSYRWKWNFQEKQVWHKSKLNWRPETVKKVYKIIFVSKFGCFITINWPAQIHSYAVFGSIFWSPKSICQLPPQMMVYIVKTVFTGKILTN